MKEKVALWLRSAPFSMKYEAYYADERDSLWMEPLPRLKKEEGLVSKVVHEGTLALSHLDALTSNRTRGLAIALARFPAYST